ncbi:hypothetical protein HDA40_001580 [Hamadaea flava]|uniref:Uncharacterized protein n=1 Tax=Hamadaea flava TaxID=1742688 RepID=A0ABV8LMX2_9ACTN|nr:hypothetical protein [Hamadaea flava]MCP2323073.1 hypothetical protein [Hamadaea flava]
MSSTRFRAAILSASTAMATIGLTVVVTTHATAAVTRYEAETPPAVCTGTIDSNHTGTSSPSTSPAASR